ncbi:DUF6969 family protein [Roseibium aggregatum]|uniref:DUF6969 domain-containing protein n=1 Tax=Roseibium aggregatum TaxID=187304 RepID=A0A939EBF8_9HYPH|nr:hypothetical protein [Roseibium aggregatum]MBN9670085.1 hypothetical protein [Roseibium aggregatum]
MSKTTQKVPCLPDVPDLADLPVERLEAMHDAAAAVLASERELAETGSSVVMEVLRGQGDFLTWERYPKGDQFDLENHSHYFYHAHAPEEMAEDENGHFHLFVRPAGVNRRMDPWRLPGATVPEEPGDRFVHIGAISVDSYGRLIRIFATNRWVTNETLYRSEDVIPLLERFRVETGEPSQVLNDWLTNLVILYRPQLEALLRQRDVTLQTWMSEYPDKDVLEDRTLQNTGEVFVNHAGQIAAIEAALGI